MTRRPRRPPAAPVRKRRAGVDEMLLARAGVGAPATPDFGAIEAMLGAAAAPAEARLAEARRGERDAAQLEALRAAVVAEPRSAVRWLALATKLRALELHAEALGAYRRVLDLDPANAEARHLVDAMSGAAPARASDGFVVAEFDAFAERYDDVLGNWLDYRGPALIAEALAAALGPAPARRLAIDLGCGTGLLAPVLRPLARRLEGVDLSARMVERARAKGLYDALAVDEIGHFLAVNPGRWDLAAAGDVFCYFGALDGVLKALSAALAPGGVVAFTVERHPREGFELRPSGRYAHGKGYVRQAAAAAGLGVVWSRESPLRTENGRPVDGACYALQRQPKPP